MTGWEALLQLGQATGKRASLTGALRDAIATGRLAPGTRLPSSRDLAADLGLSRGVVVGAYEQLVAEGRLVTRRAAGTVVAGARAPAPTLDPGSTQAGAAPRPPADDPAGTPVRTRAPRPVDGRHETPAGPDTPPPSADHTAVPTALRPGVPDLSMFPTAAWRRAYDDALREARRPDFDYPDPTGTPRLRAELADYLGRVRAARAQPAGVVVTTGAAQAFALLAAVLRGRGVTAVGTEDPGSSSIRGHFMLQGTRMVPVPVDADGLDVTALRATGVRAVFVTPAHQFPTGVVLAPARRAALVEWARECDGLVIEDDYDAEFRYDRAPVGCVQGVAPDVVALVGSVSKALVPALRLGWLVAPPTWRADLATAKEAADRGGPAVEQNAFARLLATGGYDRHLRRVRRAQRARRDAVVDALRTYLPGCRISGIAAGLHLVVELPAGTDDVALVARARAHGLAPLALSPLREYPGPPGLVIGYATLRPDELRSAIHRLATLPG